MADIRAEDFWSPGPLFTGVRGREILGSSLIQARADWGSRSPYGAADSPARPVLLQTATVVARIRYERLRLATC